MAESFLTQAEKIAALQDSLAESQAVVVALLRAFGRDVPIPDYYLTDAGDFEVTCTDDFAKDAKVFGVRRADPGIWGAAQPNGECRHLNSLKDVRGPGGWRNRGPGYDHEHWAPTELVEADLRPEPVASEILPLSDQVQPLEPLPPRIRSLSLPDGRFAFVVSGWESTGDEAHEAFVGILAEFARQCGAVATAVFPEHIEVS